MAEDEAERLDRVEVLCRLADLEASGAFGAERDDPPFRIIVVRQGAELRGYVNRCPHRGTPLEMFPGKFLDETGVLNSSAPPMARAFASATAPASAAPAAARR